MGKWESEIREQVRAFRLPREVEEKVVEALVGGAELKVNPEFAVVANGNQKWGSGGYSATYHVWLGEIEIFDRRDKSSNFISATECKIKPQVTPTVVRAIEYDGISRSGIRYFKNFVAVWTKE